MEKPKTKKELLTDEIEELTRLIEEARKNKKSSSKYKKRLIELIIELDGLEQDKEYKVTVSE
jgi:hypothetical protein